LLRHSVASADKLLPLLAKGWDKTAPETLRKNIAEKLGGFYRAKSCKNIVCEGKAAAGSGDEAQSTGSGSEDNETMVTVGEVCCTQMTSLAGAKRAAEAMLVAAVFAAELSESEKTAPVLVLGRPPGHHATCCHGIDVHAPPQESPGGPLVGLNLAGGCFYPSCWLSAVHALRSGSRKVAYIDVDAHKPDGVWREIQRLRSLPAEALRRLLGRPSACDGVLFSSVHVDGYPKPEGLVWHSADCVLPKGSRAAFDVLVQEELLKGVGEDGTATNVAVLAGFERWKKATLRKVRDFAPDGLFIGLGFDLHAAEEKVHDKRTGLGIRAQHYCSLLEELGAKPAGAGAVAAASKSSGRTGPMVLLLEGGYTKAGVVDGIRGTLEGMVRFSRARRLSQQKLLDHGTKSGPQQKRRLSIMARKLAPQTKKRAKVASQKKAIASAEESSMRKRTRKAQGGA